MSKKVWILSRFINSQEAHKYKIEKIVDWNTCSALFG